MVVRKISRASARGRRGTTDWKKVKSMSDEDIRKAAILDPDARELKDCER
jgi:hypothetical protein